MTGESAAPITSTRRLAMSPPTATIALVEYRAGTEHGVAQIASAVWPGGATETEEQEPP